MLLQPSQRRGDSWKAGDVNPADSDQCSALIIQEKLDETLFKQHCHHRDQRYSDIPMYIRMSS